MMIPDAPWACTLAVIVLLAAPAALLALALRRSQSPGGPLAAAIVAGIFVGLIAGPGVLGRARPDIYAPLFLGGSEQAQTLRALSSRQVSDRAALEAIKPSLAALEELSEQHLAARRPAEEALEKAMAERRLLLDTIAAILVAMHLYAAAGAILPVGPRAGARLAISLVEHQAAPILVGLLAVAVSILIPACVGLLILPPRQSVALALILSVPALSLTLRPPLLLACFASLILCGVGSLTLAWSAPFTIIVGGLMAGLLVPLTLSPRQGQSVRRVALPLASALTLPAIAALLAARLDLLHLADDPATIAPFWFALIAGLLWSSDGRMACLWLACRVFGWPDARRRPWSAAARAGNAGIGVSQLALTVAFMPAGLAPEPIIAGALFGAALVELSRAPRAWLARALEAGRPDALD